MAIAGNRLAGKVKDLEQGEDALAIFVEEFKLYNRQIWLGAIVCPFSPYDFANWEYLGGWQTALEKILELLKARQVAATAKVGGEASADQPVDAVPDPLASAIGTAEKILADSAEFLALDPGERKIILDLRLSVMVKAKEERGLLEVIEAAVNEAIKKHSGRGSAQEPAAKAEAASS